MSVPKSHHGYSPTATGNNSQAAASNSNMRWLQAPDVNLRNLSRTESDVSLALHDTNRSGRRWRRVGLATAIATLRGSRNASRKRLDEVSRVRLPESADPTVYGIDRCSWASEPSTDIVSCQAFCTRRRFSSRLLTRWNQAEPRLDTAGQRAQPGGSRLGRDTQSAQVLFDGASKKPVA